VQVLVEPQENHIYESIIRMYILKIESKFSMTDVLAERNAVADLCVYFVLLTVY